METVLGMRSTLCSSFQIDKNCTFIDPLYYAFTYRKVIRFPGEARERKKMLLFLPLLLIKSGKVFWVDPSRVLS